MTLLELRRLMSDAGPERMQAWRRLFRASSDEIPVDHPLYALIVDAMAAMLVDELRERRGPIH